MMLMAESCVASRCSNRCWVVRPPPSIHISFPSHLLQQPGNAVGVMCCLALLKQVLGGSVHRGVHVAEAGCRGEGGGIIV